VAVSRKPESVVLETRSPGGELETPSFDKVVIATHADTALSLLTDATEAEQRVLGAFGYSTNHTLLHRDDTVLPGRSQERASWNYRLDSCEAVDDRTRVSYWMNRLQGHPERDPLVVTLNPDPAAMPRHVVAEMSYEHPTYTRESVAAQAELPSLNSDRLAFAGAYHGWGFHEDGARSGHAAATRLGLAWPRPAGTVGTQVEPGLFRTTIRHTRRTPFTRTFENRSHLWLVDLDDLPEHGVLARFEARDHLGSPDRSIRANVEQFGALHGLDLTGGRILMATNPRSVGYCFNPITVFWCFDGAGAQRAVVVEVHNTYGDRHAYLVRPDEQGRARTDKQMYVSPFHDVAGHYEIAVPVPDDRLTVAVTLHHPQARPFSASVVGDRVPPSRLPAQWRSLDGALRGSALIRAHGIWLWARRLPVRPRPPHRQEGVR